MIDHPIVLRDLEVIGVAAITPGIRRVTLGGEQLRPFIRDGHDCAAFATAGFDDHVRILPDPTVLPAQEDGHLHWPDDPPCLTRDYTVARFDPVAGQLDLDIVLGHGGPGASWGERAAVGDRIHIAGPPRSHTHSDDGAGWLLVGDETSLPAIARFLHEHDTLEATAIVVSRRENMTYPLPPGRVQWVAADPSMADPAGLGDAVVAALGADPGRFVWAALEFTAARRVRALLRDAGVGKDRCFVTHYWRHSDQTDESRRDLQRTIRPMIDLMTPTVLRVAVTIGLLDAIVAGATTRDAIASSTGCDRNAIGVLLDFLASKGIVGTGGGGYTVTALGEPFLDEGDNFLPTFLHLRRPSGHMSTALAGLLETVTTGGSAYQRVHGRSFWDTLSTDESLGAGFDDQLAGWARQWVPAVVALDLWSGVTSIVDVGGGRGTFASALAEAHPSLSATLVELAGPAARARATIDEAGVGGRVDVRVQSFFDPLPPGADVYTVAQVLHDWPDEDAIAILRRCAEAAGSAGRVLVVERLAGADAPSGGDDDHAVMGVLMLALFGSKERTADDYGQLLAAAGLRVVSVHRHGPLGVIEAVAVNATAVPPPGDRPGQPEENP